MAGRKHWTITQIEDGYREVTLSKWRWFGDYISQQLLDYRTYVFRGHSSDRWRLESTLDRALKRLGKDKREAARTAHLTNFHMAARGRRGSHPRQLPTEDEWWALGQHHGLATPLLDWTESPFVALYFAFAEVDTHGADHRAVWAISQLAVPMIQRKHKRFDEMRIVNPLSDENARLVSQRGLFIRCPPEITIDEAAKEAFAKQNKLAPIFKIRIPNQDRTDCLRFLNRMNINALTLFPDLVGASVHCNTDLSIHRY